MTPVLRGWPGSSLRRTLAASYCLLVLLIVATGLCGVAAFSVASDGADRESQRMQPARQANREALLSMTQVQSGLRGYLLIGEPAVLEDVRAARQAALAHLSDLRQLTQDLPDTHSVARQHRQAITWLQRYADPVLASSRRPGGLAQARDTRDNTAARRSFQTLRMTNSSVTARVEREIGSLRHRVRVARDWALGVLLFVGLLSVLAGSASALRASRSMLSPLSRLRAALDRLAAGDHDARADETAGPAEVRAVGRAINALADESDRYRTADQDQQRARRLAHDVGLRIRARIDNGDVEGVAVAELAAAFGVDRILLRRVDGERLGPVTTQWQEYDLSPLDEAALSAIAANDDDAPALRLWAEVEVTIEPDPVTAGLGFIEGAGTVLVCAFGAGHDLFGTLTLIHSGQRHWSNAEISALESIAADLGRAWQHSGLYERERTLVTQLKELDRSKTDFMSTVSHELRTPLTSIAGYAELLRDGDAGAVSAEQKRMLDVIDRNADRLGSLIEDLLALSRIESRAFGAQAVPVDVESLVHNATAAIEPQAAAAGVRLAMADGRHPGRVQVLGDPGQLDRVLLNLLSNGVKFTPAGGEIELSWQVSADEVLLRVSDSGIGVPSDELAQLSTRFFRASNATSRAIQGTGLGLTIVRGIVEHHGGSLRLDSTEGRGTRVEVRLPRHRCEAERSQPFQASIGSAGP